MDLKKIYQENQAFLEGHFLLSSGKHSQFYLQSAKVLENPKTAEVLAKKLAELILKNGIKIDVVCSPALGGLLAGYELARALGVRFIFTERKNGKMEMRRGFQIKAEEKVLICEDIITTGGSALESGDEVKKQGGKIVGFAALANRGFCSAKLLNSEVQTSSKTCKLPKELPLFALDNFQFEVYEENERPLCKKGSKAIKPGSRN